MKRNRYPGTKPFSTEQQDLFFGRDGDVEELLNRISLQQMIVLYSKSGLGKSSLINAGLVPRLQETGSVKYLKVRFGAFADDNTESPTVKTKRVITAIGSKGGGTLLDKLIPNRNSLWYHLKNQQILTGRDRFLLLFDQFEELFTYSQGEIHNFKKELSELLNEKIPNDFRKVLDRQFEGGQSILTEHELEALHRTLEVKVLMAIRSDRLSLLNDLKDFFPKILRHCFELGELTLKQAQAAILLPARKVSSAFVTPAFDYEPAALDRMLSFLTNDGQHRIDSFQLQILCHSIERRIQEQPTATVTTKLIGDVESIYKNYYENQINQINDPGDRLAARKLMEEGMIFEKESRRLSVYEGQIHTEFRVREEVLQKLVDYHLIRAEPSLRGGYTYEISHDSLVAPILEAYRKRRRHEEREAAEREQKIIEEKLRKEQRQKRRIRRAAVVSTVFFIVALLAAIAAVAQNEKVRAAKKKVEEQNDELEKKNQELFKGGVSQLFDNIRDGAEFLKKEEYTKADENFTDAGELLNYLEEFGQKISPDTVDILVRDYLEQDQVLIDDRVLAQLDSVKLLARKEEGAKTFERRELVIGWVIDEYRQYCRRSAHEKADLDSLLTLADSLLIAEKPARAREQFLKVRRLDYWPKARSLRGREITTKIELTETRIIDKFQNNLEDARVFHEAHICWKADQAAEVIRDLLENVGDSGVALLGQYELTNVWPDLDSKIKNCPNHEN